MALTVYLADLVHDYLPGNYVVPLNIGYMAAYVQEKFSRDVDVRLFKSPSELIEALKANSPHIIGFSNYSWNQELNREIIEHFISPMKKTIVVFGGPHIRTNNAGIQEFLEKNSYVDYYCMFEGEIPFGNIVENMLSQGISKSNNCDQGLPGVAFIRDKQLVYTALEFKKGIIEDCPSPYLTGLMDKFLRSDQWIPLLETNRGCPFHCTFCVWGISAMDKVRVFPMDRVLEEIRLVGQNSPSPLWIFADANFGMLKRDISIAKELRRVADKYKILNHANLWWAKNSSPRATEIVKILGGLSDPLVAVQTMDLEILKNIKRDNIKLETMTDLLAEFRKRDFKVNTDVLVGLPGESFESHLNTLRDVFTLNYNRLDVGNIRLLPGSEMESDETREKYQLETKYRLISGGFGEYGGISIFEFEESVRASKDIKEEEMISLRLIHFLIWAFWNLGIAKPILFLLQHRQQINPVDAIIALTQGDSNDAFADFSKEFKKEAINEWFDTAEGLKEYYSSQFNELIQNGFLKMNFKYLAKTLLNKDFAKVLLESIASKLDLSIKNEVIQFCFDRIYFPEDVVPTKNVSYSEELTQIIKQVFPAATVNSNICNFNIDQKIFSAINFNLKKFRMEQDPLRALTLTLEYESRFLYDFRFGEEGKKEILGNLKGSFDYHSQYNTNPS
jgi:radical SAM superfamily enzyme YgiQ (UPF0313 family)